MSNFDLEKGYIESFKDIEENTLINGKVIDISGDTVFLDVGLKSEAKLSISDFDVLPKINDNVDLFLTRMEDRNGDPVVSKKKADQLKEKKELITAYRKRENLEGTIINAKNNGFQIKYKNIYGFIPFPLFDFSKVENPSSFVNKSIKFAVEKLTFKDENKQQQQQKRPQNKFQNNKNTKQNNSWQIDEEFIGNRKKVLNEENKVLKLSFLENKEEGDIVEGEVKTITSFGAFVDLKGVEALLHIKDISWSKISKVEDALKIGDKLLVKILSIDKTNGKVSVGLKQTQPEPWTIFIKKHKENDIVIGTVTSLISYGVFVKIIDGVEGLLHISDMSWTKNIRNPSELVKKGQQIEVKIVNIDEENKKINLSLKHLLTNPWDKAEDKYKVGSLFKGTVKSIVAFGLFLELEEGIDALLHIDDISWTETPKNLHKDYKIGDVLNVVILQCDIKNSKIRVGIKQISEDPWKKLADLYKTGDTIECIVDSIDDNKGLYVKVVDNIYAYIPFNQIGYGKIDEIKSKVAKDFKNGDRTQAIITEFNSKKQFIKLSIKEFIKKEENKKVSEFLHGNEDDKFTLGDMLRSKNNN